MRKQLATVGLAASLVAGGAGALALVGPGVSFAQEATEEAPAVVEPGADREGPLVEALQPLVDDGTLTQAQADAVIETLRETMPRGGHGPGMRGGPGLEAAAETLGLSVEDLATALRDGQTMAELAEANGVEVQAVVEALVAEAEGHLAEKVAEGELTQDEADERLAGITERITARVNGERPEGAPDAPLRDRLQERFGS